MLRAGYCAHCDHLVWRVLVLPSGEKKMLWPDPAARFAAVSTGPDSVARGIAYCEACEPALGSLGPELTTDGHPVPPGLVVEIEDARERYHACFTPKYGAWLSAWLRDVHPPLEEGDILAIEAAWRADADG